MRLYSDLTPWYHLLDPPGDHADEADAYTVALLGAIRGPAETLLELGSGAGHNAVHMKRRFRCTLSDISEPMLALSRRLNPDCEHAIGDMRALRLGRRFDAVLVHDAVVYLTSEADLLAASATAFEHLREGGAALFAPDHLRDGFEESTELLAGDDGTRGLKGLAWVRDPDPDDTAYTVDYVLLLREGVDVQAVHERHIEGLFSEADWHRILTSAGFRVETIARPVDVEATDRVFLCRKP